MFAFLVVLTINAGLALETLSSGLASMARMPIALGQSTSVAPNLRPHKMQENLVFYDGGETDATSREVRECLTFLDLSVMIYPSGPGCRYVCQSARFGTPPLLLDGEAVATGADIVPYLLSKYGVEGTKVEDSLRSASHLFASAIRGNRGSRVDVQRALLVPPREPLVLFNYEGNQFCRLVREELFELDLPYRSIACGKGSPRRELELLPISNATQCPYLYDPNTGVRMAESRDIVKYLERTYAQPGPVDDLRRRALKAELAAFALKARSGIDALSDSDKTRFDAALAELTASNPTRAPATSGLLNGTWKLLWTTETELLFIMKNGLGPGLPCTAVTQSLDLEAGRLVNYVGCGTSYLSVGSSIVVPDRSDGSSLDFEFQSCTLRYRQLTLPLPPVGKGRFRIAYLDHNFRVQVDSRGDTLISGRGQFPIGGILF